MYQKVSLIAIAQKNQKKAAQNGEGNNLQLVEESLAKYTNDGVVDEMIQTAYLRPSFVINSNKNSKTSPLAVMGYHRVKILAVLVSR